MATTFLNLINHEWLQRFPAWVELLALLFSGAAPGAGLCLVRPWMACALSLGTGFIVMIAAVLLSYHGNTWFPWLITSGGQAPCALAWALATAKTRRGEKASAKTIVISTDDVIPAQHSPNAPDYDLFDPPFGEGAYGKVWLARNAIGQW